MIRVAVLGCGIVARDHVRIIGTLPNVQIVGFCDHIIARAEELAAGSCETFNDYHRMVVTLKPDAVFVFIPPNAHGDPERTMIEHGIHFFVEKPVALTMATALDIRNRAREAGVVAGVGFQCRYSPLSARAREFSQEGIVYAHCARIGGIPDNPWWIQRKVSGGQLVEQAIHQLDLVRWFLGRPIQVFATPAHGFVHAGHDYDIDDASAAIITFESGVIMTFAAGCYASAGAAYDSTMILSTPTARAELKPLESLRIVRASSSTPPVITPSGLEQEADDAVECYHERVDARRLCDMAFLDAVYANDEKHMLVNYAEGCETLTLALALNQSMETALPVQID